jgi:hypothetical protein
VVHAACPLHNGRVPAMGELLSLWGIPVASEACRTSRGSNNTSGCLPGYPNHAIACPWARVQASGLPSSASTLCSAWSGGGGSPS